MKAIFLLFSVAWATSFAADTPKPKYGPNAKTLHEAHDYFRSHAAPDYWAIAPYYVPQFNDRACSVASVTMVLNAARKDWKLSADDALITQQTLLDKPGLETWKKAVGDGGKGVTLDELGGYVEKAFQAAGFTKVETEIVHFKDTSPTSLKKLREILNSNEKSERSFVIINFLQGIYTGDADIGHIAPIGTYDSGKKSALVMDPDRSWYVPYWVSDEVLLKGMATADPGSGKNRGLVWIKGFIR
ncbi:phytochelatin synthase family protein [bacterium]|nr:phytochelatin synthase family protein [bacterium]